MARTSKKKPKLDTLEGTADPRAPLDAAALLAASRSLLARLEADLQARATASPAVAAGLRARWEAEKAAERTAESFAGWSAALATQVAAAWLLSCVFVRTLEDRGLLRQARLAGPGAMDSQRQFFQLAPSLTERDYLLMVFRELAQHPAAAGLFDQEHSLVWKLSPSAELARELLALWRMPSAETPAFRFGQASTRFLGDLYQDLSEDVRKRYALLQTPDFVEAFILDRTLEPAVARFGLDDVELIDPTCGSGHFLLGAFERLFEARLRAEPGVDRRVAAARALGAVYGADINPYAVAIARFRLTLAYLDKAGFAKLAEAPALPLHVVVADSLRVNAQHAQAELWQQEGVAGVAGWLGERFALEDEEEARRVLFRQYAAVVGNPPYITEKDPAKREVYRRMYVSAAGKYALSAPFCERFFQLARARGFTGQITANSFMKREFGKKLVEEYLPTVNLELIVNTSGAYIPGHGTPTVLLFGTMEPPIGRDVLAVLAKRGEPSTPEEPAQGLVWRSVVEGWDQVGFENEYVSVARVEREGLRRHPWSLGGGGAAELKELLEERAAKRLGEVATSIGIASVTGEDEVFLLPEDVARRLRVGRTRPLVTGEYVRDWSLQSAGEVLFPYDESLERLPAGELQAELRYLWPYRSAISRRKRFGVPMLERGLTWYELQELYADKLRTPLTITFAEVATHNHFVLDRGGKIFKQTAPIIKLPADATEDDHLALLAYLNSSTACFWMKQVAQAKASHTEERPEKFLPGMVRFQFSASSLSPIPLPSQTTAAALAALGRRAEKTVQRRATYAASAFVSALERGDVSDATAFERGWDDGQRELIAVQEDLDWAVYGSFGLIDPEAAMSVAGDWRLAHPERIFLSTNPPADLEQRAVAVWRARAATLQAHPTLMLLENAEFKRRWDGGRGSFGQKSRTYLEEAIDEATARCAAHLEAGFSGSATLRAADAWTAGDAGARRVLDWLTRTTGADPTAIVASILLQQSVPFLAAQRLTESGLAVLAEWERVWREQRLEDEGTAAAPLPPPRYDVSDWLEKRLFDLRGKLDVPKERFISYPGCESDDDGEPVYGWAGWDHLQRAQALAALYMKRKDGEGWPRERLTPMLAGLLELLPWLQQWHNAPSADYDGLRMGDYFAQFLDGECRLHNLTHADLRAWRPARKTRGKPKPTATPAAAAAGDDADIPRRKPRTRKKASGDSEEAP